MGMHLRVAGASGWSGYRSECSALVAPAMRGAGGGVSERAGWAGLGALGPGHLADEVGGDQGVVGAPDVACACGHKGSHNGIECRDAKGKGPRRRRRLVTWKY